MDLGIDGKKALVCGASAGLGFATAMALAAEGADVTINSRDQKRLEAAADRIEKATGRRPECLVADLSTDKGINTVTQGVRKDTPGGFIDILVSNTGGPPSGRFMHFSHQQWKDAAELLLYSASQIGLLHALLPVSSMHSMRMGSVPSGRSISTCVNGGL